MLAVKWLDFKPQQAKMGNRFPNNNHDYAFFGFLVLGYFIEA